MNFRNFFTTRARIARPPDPPLDRFEHEHPESFAFPPHRMLDAIDYGKHRSRSHDAVMRVYDDAGKGGRPPLVAPNIEGGAIPVPDAHSCALGAPFQLGLVGCKPQKQ